jgi:general secretion pathway protein I
MNRGFNHVGEFLRISQKCPGRHRQKRAGFTLLEIILSLAILAGALAALGEVMRAADRSASAAEDETRAQILAASVMDELVAGSRELAATDNAAVSSTDDPPWACSIAVDQTGYDELVAVRVRVQQQIEARLQPASYELVRWLPNPNFTMPDTSQQTGTSTTSTSSSSSSGASSGAGVGGQP